MKRQVLFVFGNQACVPNDPLLAAKQLGCQTTIFGPSTPCGVSATVVDRFERVSLRNPDKVVAAARALHSIHPIHAVVGYDDEAVPVVARIAASLGLPGHPVEAADAARDKVLMKQRFELAGLPIAPYRLAVNEDAAACWANNKGYPVVIKPVCGSASQGVMRADNEQELRENYRRLRRIVRDYGLDTGGRSDSEQLVECYLDGSEVSVELLIQDGVPHVLCVFEKPQPLHGPFFEESLYVTPTRLLPVHNVEVQDLAVRAAKALGLRNGAAHCELRLSAEGPFVLEIGARVIGGACSRVFRAALGEDIHPYVLRLALNDKVCWPQLQAAAAGAMMLPIPAEGRLMAVRGVDRARKVPGIQEVIITASPGDVIVPFPEQSCYVGFLTAKADSPETVADALVKAAKQIDMDLEPLECRTFSREIADHQSYQPPAHYHIQSLENCDWEKARSIILPLVASIHFGEFPSDLAMEKAKFCVHWLEEGNRGETSPAFWLISKGRGLALGSYSGDTCYISCLGVLPEHRRTGLGEALVRSAMALFARRGCKRIEGPVDPRQPSSNGLLGQRIGFVVSDSKTDGQICCTC